MKTIDIAALRELVGVASSDIRDAARALIVADTEERFVAPRFVIHEEPRGESASVMLVAAPAAVGKSALARELSRSTFNPLIDLGGRRIAEAFFTGFLGKEVGAHNAIRVQDELRAGRGTLIIDALDEAMVASGAQSFAAAVHDLIDLLGAGERHPQSERPVAILLGRPDTIDDAEQILHERRVQTSRVEVSFFDREQATAFVKLKSRDERHREALRELDDFLEQFFELVTSALGGTTWDDGASFVGYAPVLDALATFYSREDNPMARLSQIRNSGTSQHVWGLLVEIIRSVLKRETEKFATAFGADNTEKSRYGGECYTIDLQLRMLLSEAPMQFPVTPEVEPPNLDWLDELESQVRNQFQVHPFLLPSHQEQANPLLRFANLAFRDFVIASALAASHSDQAVAIREYWAHPDVPISPILARIALTKELGLSEVSGDAVPLIVASHSVDGPVESSAQLEINAEEQQVGAGPGHAVIVELFERGELTSHLRAYLSAGDPLHLVAGISRVTVDAPGLRVIAGEGAQDFVIGPDADIICGDFNSEATEVRVRATEWPNYIQADRLTGLTRRISPGNPDLLKLLAPSGGFPWSTFLVKRDAGNTGNNHLWAAAAEFRGNAKWYIKKSMVKGAPNYPADVMDTILAKGRASRVAHDFGIETSTLVRLDGRYEMRLQGFTIHTIYAMDIQNVMYCEYLRRFLAWCDARNIQLV